MTGLRLRTEVFSTHSAYYGGRPCFAVVVRSPSSHTLLRYSFTYPTNKQTNTLPCVPCAAVVAQSIINTRRRTQVTEIKCYFSQKGTGPAFSSRQGQLIFLFLTVRG